LRPRKRGGAGGKRKGWLYQHRPGERREKKGGLLVHKGGERNEIFFSAYLFLSGGKTMRKKAKGRGGWGRRTCLVISPPQKKKDGGERKGEARPLPDSDDLGGGEGLESGWRFPFAWIERREEKKKKTKKRRRKDRSLFLFFCCNSTKGRGGNPGRRGKKKRQAAPFSFLCLLRTGEKVGSVYKTLSILI